MVAAGVRRQGMQASIYDGKGVGREERGPRAAVMHESGNQLGLWSRATCPSSESGGGSLLIRAMDANGSTHHHAKDRGGHCEPDRT